MLHCGDIRILPTLVEETLVALALVRLAFLTAVRLLIRDFFAIDIVRSFLNCLRECQLTLHRDCQTVARPARHVACPVLSAAYVISDLLGVTEILSKG